MPCQSDACLAMIQRGAEVFGASIWGVETHLEREGMTHFDVFIESPDGVTATLCIDVAKQIQAIFGAEGMARDTFSIDVSSPGIGRRFYSASQCEAYVGHKMTCVLGSGQKIHGQLQSVEAAQLSFQVDAEAQLILNFDALKTLSLYDGDLTCQP